jgi:hypothetical protein
VERNFATEAQAGALAVLDVIDVLTLHWHARQLPENLHSYAIR